MARPISMAIRQSIIEGLDRGERITSLALKFGVSRGSIYNLLKRVKTSSGESSLRPNYAGCGKRRPTPEDFVFRAVRCLRTWHPAWGAEKIWGEMRCMRPELILPSHRTMSRWMRWNEQIPSSLRNEPPQPKAPKASRLHD